MMSHATWVQKIWCGTYETSLMCYVCEFQRLKPKSSLFFSNVKEIKPIEKWWRIEMPFSLLCDTFLAFWPLWCIRMKIGHIHHKAKLVVDRITRIQPFNPYGVALDPKKPSREEGTHDAHIANDVSKTYFLIA